MKLYTEKYAESILSKDHFPKSMLKTFIVAVIVKNLKYMTMRAFTF